MNKYLRLFRFGNGLMGIIGVLIGAFLAVGLNIGDYVANLIVSCIIVVIFMAGGNSLNDYIDIEIDRTAHPDRPLPKGEISRNTALYLGIGGLVVAILLSLFLTSIWTTILVIGAAIFMVAYEMTLKQHGFVGNITIGVLTGMIFLFGGMVVGHLEDVLIFGVMAILVSIGREISKDIEDMNSDEGRTTLPMKIGEKKASWIAMFFFILGPIVSILPFIDGTFGLDYGLIFVADVMFIYAATIVSTNAHATQKMAKYAMIVALFAFIIGVIL